MTFKISHLQFVGSLNESFNKPTELIVSIDRVPGSKDELFTALAQKLSEHYGLPVKKFVCEEC